MAKKASKHAFAKAEARRLAARHGGSLLAVEHARDKNPAPPPTVEREPSMFEGAPTWRDWFASRPQLGRKVGMKDWTRAKCDSFGAAQNYMRKG